MMAAWRVMVATMLLAAPALAQVSGQNASTALVISLQGDWRSADLTLKPIDTVSVGQIIAPGPQPKRGDHISISLYDGTQVTLRCSRDDSCDPPYTVPDTRPRAPGLIERMGRVLQQLGAPDVDHLITPAVRGAGPQDAVVLRQADGRVDLGPALGAMAPGRYQAEFRTWTGARPTGNSRSLRAVVQASGGVIAPGDPGPPGPYELTLIDASGALAGKAVILIASPAEYEPLRLGLDRVRMMTASWTQTAGAGDVRQFLQFYLLALGRDHQLALETP